MPIYEFQCKVCGKRYEVLQRYDDPLPKCSCGLTDERMDRLISAGNFELKGTGWYKTDFKGG
jgi:putative FmdB family regulatory protein